jgi:hypothetical protein
MKQVLFFGIILLSACANSPKNNKATVSSDTYFEFSVDGKTFTVSEDAVSTSYNKFGDKTEFKIFAGENPSLTLTIPNDMSKPSSTPSGGAVGTAIAQGSASLQNYPDASHNFNSFDYMATPPQTPVADAIVITTSELIGTEGRLISGTINVTTVPDSNNNSDPANKPYKIVGKFKVKHLFKGDPF